VIAAAMKMSRSEAVRVLAMSIKFGAAAAPALEEGLTSSKAYLRHGCALALALLGSEGSTEAVIGLLLSEPTELWREIARAIGRIGTEALIPLATHHGRLGDRAALSSERVAWALAHIAVRGGQDAVAALASGQGAIAPVAARGIDLLALATGDHDRDRSSAAGAERDVTVNHAFSRQFFEALENGLPDAMELDAAASAEP
jgi:HEAT repeat protein